MEKENIPAAVLSTEPFIEQSNMMAKVHYYSQYPIVATFHPLATATNSEIECETQRIFEQVIQLLIVNESNLE